jgi:uncharacterized protein involved in outer membrane biogenesis
MRSARGTVRLDVVDGAVTVERADLGIGNATLEVTGQITDIAAPAGELQISAGDLGLLELVEFFSEFAAGGESAGPSAPTAPVSASPSMSGMDLSLVLEASSARMGTMTLDALTGRARVTASGLTLEPLRFGAFGGTVEGALAFSLGGVPAFELAANLDGVDAAAAMAFVGSPDTISGVASGRLELMGTGLTAGDAMRSARGTVRLDVVDGAVKGLGLVRTLVLATSMRSDSQAEIATTRPDGSFTRLGMTAAVDAGVASTSDLVFESPDVLLAGAGTIQLVSTEVDLVADVQLSEALSSSAGRDLVRYTQQEGRVTLPATVTGPVEALAVRLDAADATRRALTNRAEEAAKNALGRLIKRIR